MYQAQQKQRNQMEDALACMLRGPDTDIADIVGALASVCKWEAEQAISPSADKAWRMRASILAIAVGNLLKVTI